MTKITSQIKKLSTGVWFTYPDGLIFRTNPNDNRFIAKHLDVAVLKKATISIVVREDSELLSVAFRGADHAKSYY
jgi:hypothetical protein